MVQRQSPGRLALSEVVSIILLVIGVVILNLLTNFYANPAFLAVVTFFNINFIFLLVLSLVFFVGDLFAVFMFPVNLPAPVFRAIASTFLVVFIVRVLKLIESITGENIFGVFYSFTSFIYALVFLLVLIFGYISIFTALIRRKEKIEKKENKKLDEFKKGKIKEAVEDKKKPVKKKK